MIFNILEHSICGDGTPSFLGIFDLSIAPPLLFYSYIPIIITSLLLGFYIFIEDRKSLQSKLLLSVTILFVLWVLNILVQWIASYNAIVMFAWQLTAILEVSLFLTTIYFAYVFINKKDLPPFWKLVLWVLELITIFLIPTKFNVSSYDLQNCEGVIGPLWNIIYSIEPAVIVLIIYMGFSAIRKESDRLFRKQITIFTIGLTFFLTTFFVFNFYGELTQVYQFNLWGPIGMVIFLGLLSYLIVKFQTFHTKLIATQVLVWSLVILVGSQLFFVKNSINRILTIITLLASVIFGYFLIRSVKKEIEQKEKLATLNVQLEDLLKQRESLVHLVTHKVKGAFTRSKYIFAGLLDGTFGEVNPEVKKYAKMGLESDNGGIQTVDLVLNASNLTTGTVKYDMKPLDFKEIIAQVVSDKKVQAEAKGLQLEGDIHNDEKDNYKVLGDAIWLREAVNNLIDNSIKYTKEGKIMIELHDGGGKVKFSIKDTGIGITEEDKKNLFTEGGRGKESVKVNVDSTGYGLYSVKLIIEAHKGRVWGESEGEGKGSAFFVELPVAQG
jgi:signal transduction histidine kinase